MYSSSSSVSDNCMVDAPEVPRVLFDDLIPGFAGLMNSFGEEYRALAYSGLCSDKGCSVGGRQDILPWGVLLNVEMLFVRSTTQVSERLLAQFPALKFVATATSGIDHLDISAIESRGIYWCDAKGSNAHAVADYVVYCLKALQMQGIRFQPGNAVVVGRGCVGTEVVQHLAELGCQSFWVDPFLEPAHSNQYRLQLSEMEEAWLSTTTLLSVHTPLRFEKPWPTLAWLNETRLAALPDGAIVVCAGRGEVIEAKAVLAHCYRLHFILDVWPDEPGIDPMLLDKVTLGTPHIAGHSLLGKLKGSWQVFTQCIEWLELRHHTPALRKTKEQFFIEVLGQRTGLCHAQEYNKPQSEGIDVLNHTLQRSKLDGGAQKMIDVSAKMKLTTKQADDRDQICQCFKDLRRSYFQHDEIQWQKS